MNNGLKADSLARKSWFKSGPVGVNKLNGLMKTMVQKAGIENDRLQNHSGRKTMIQTLSENAIPHTQIAQLSGHRNLKSIENYSTVSTKRQMLMSKVLSGVVAGTPASSCSETACPSSSTFQNTGKQSVALFSGAVIQGGNFSIHINTVSDNSPTLTPDPSTPEAARWKRLRPLELESDSDDNRIISILVDDGDYEDVFKLTSKVKKNSQSFFLCNLQQPPKSDSWVIAKR